MENKKTTLNHREFIWLNMASFTGAMLTPSLVAEMEPHLETTVSPDNSNF